MNHILLCSNFMFQSDNYNDLFKRCCCQIVTLIRTIYICIMHQLVYCWIAKTSTFFAYLSYSVSNAVALNSTNRLFMCDTSTTIHRLFKSKYFWKFIQRTFYSSTFMTDFHWVFSLQLMELITNCLTLE